MNFWLPAVAIPVATALLLCWPMLRGKGPLMGAGVAMLLLIPMTTLLLYQGVGSPDGIDVQAGHRPAQAGGEDQMAALLQELQTRLEANPEDLEGWLLLGRSYKSVQRYEEALLALRRAQQIAPQDPLVQVELAEAMIFTSGNREIGSDVRDLLQSALALEPDLQKALWLLGITEFQVGNYEAALTHWQRLMTQLEPGSGIAQSVQQQMDEARARLGQPVASAWAGIQATVTWSPEMGEPPAGAVLFVIARDPAAPRPPLGAVRLENPEFPVTVTITDANSMMAERPISSAGVIEVVARLSLSGQPIAGAGDPESAPAQVDGTNPAAVQLELLPSTP